MKKKLFALILASLFIALLFAIPIEASTAVTINTTVNVTAARKNLHGHGYEWDNINSILTLTDLDLKTKDDYGIKLPEGATVVLVGDNHISAGKYGISCSGNVIFKGNGSLTIEAGNIGIYLFSQDKTTKIRVLDGKYSITAGEYGIYSEYSDFSIVGGTFDISTSAENGRAILGRVVSLVGGKLKSDSSLEATHSLEINSIDLDIDSSTSAIIAKNLSLKNESVDEYNGENTIIFEAQTRWHSKSIIFGDKVGGWADYLAAIIVFVLVALCIILPILNRKKKKIELYRNLVEQGYMTQAEADEKLGKKKEEKKTVKKGEKK